MFFGNVRGNLGPVFFIAALCSRDPLPSQDEHGPTAAEKTCAWICVTVPSYALC